MSIRKIRITCEIQIRERDAEEDQQKCILNVKSHWNQGGTVVLHVPPCGVDDGDSLVIDGSELIKAVQKAMQ